MDTPFEDVNKMYYQALLEISQSLVSNTEEKIYRSFMQVVKRYLACSQIALISYGIDRRWTCKFSYAFDEKVIKDFIDELNTNKSSPSLVDQSHTVLPIKEKKSVIAFLLIHQKDIKHSDFLKTIGKFVIQSIENQQLIKKKIQQEALNKELEIAQEVQNLLFPKSLPKTKHLEIKAHYSPHFSIGGDYYDYIPISKDKFLVCIADVSGKGIPAALLMSNFQASLRMLVKQSYHLENIIDQLNYLIYENAGGEQFITLFVAIYDTKEKTLHYINAGHNPPFLYYNDQYLVKLDKGTTILGAFSKLPFLEMEVIEDIHTFLLLAFTDGLVETYNPSQEAFGMERLKKILEENHMKSLDQLHNNLIAHVEKFKANMAYHDDVTLLTCKVSP